MIVYLDGRLVDENRARVPAAALDFFGAPALAENMRVEGGEVPLLHLHAGRLAEGARAWKLPAPPLAGLARAAGALLARNRLLRGSLRLRWLPRLSGRPLLLLHPFAWRPLPKSWGSGIRLLTLSTREEEPAGPVARTKTGSMLPHWMARHEVQAWAEDGLRLTGSGLAAEGIWSNILAEKNGVLLTAPAHQGILEGVTRRACLDAWRAKGGRVRERAITREDLYTAERAWACSSVRGLVKIREVDGRRLGLPPCV